MNYPYAIGYVILPVLVLLAGKMPALQEILGSFLNWKSLNVVNNRDSIPSLRLQQFCRQSL